MQKGQQKNGIEVYVRVRPSKKVDTQMILHANENKIEFNLKKEGLQNDEVREQNHIFEFNGILDMLTKQETVFDKIAKDVVDSCFDGYNGTIFAYGQTGSGKTFTITGGAERYADRGVIPRTLSYIFGRVRSTTTHQFSVNVSYLEIYNEDGFDLLDENHSSKNLYDLQKVIIRENEQSQFVLTHLSVHRAENEEDALNLLFIGDTNRVVSQTPKNDASTRGHCIFIIQIESQKVGEDVKTVSKLHLVDLSGSERPSQTGIDGKTLSEALYINGSLLQLSLCIQMLNKKAKNPGQNIFVPYRNSMMTMVLRDSLGGNCKTKMIATVSAKKEDLYESLSTCRFAKNVSLIQNKVTRNESVDPGVIISRLKKEIAELKAELAIAKGGEQKDHLTSEDIERCNLMVKDFIDTTDPHKTLVLPDRLLINQCFYHFKTLYKTLEKKKGGATNEVKAIKDDIESDHKTQTTDKINLQQESEINRLNMLVKQRDQEIGIMLSYLNKKKEQGSLEGVPVQSIPQQEEKPQLLGMQSNGFQNQQSPKGGSTLFQMMSGSKQNPYGNQLAQKSIKEKRIEFELNQQNSNANKGFVHEIAEVQQMVIAPIQCTIEDLSDRARAFDMFRKSYRKNEAMEDNRNLLKEKYQRGKDLGALVNQSRNLIKQYTSEIEQIRKQNAMRGLVDQNTGEIIKTAEEDEYQSKITKLKREYQSQYNELKDLKQEIERIQALLERCREKLQKDFEQWLQVMIKQKQMEQGSSDIQYSKGQQLTNQIAENFGSTDKRVQDNLKEFYKARDAIHNETQK